MLHILIADDERPIREWIQLCIERQFPGKFIFDTAANGQQAVDLFQEYHPKIVLADIKMPIIDGLSLAEHIRKTNSGTAVVIITSHADFNLARAALQKNIRDYILKTEITEELLAELIRKLLYTVTPADNMVQELLWPLSDSLTLEDRLEQIRASDQQQPVPPYFLCAVRSADRNPSTLRTACRTQLSEAFRARVDEKTCIVCYNLHVVPSVLLQYQTAFQFMTELKAENPDSIFSCSDICSSITQLEESFKAAVNLLDLAFYGGSGVYMQPDNNSRSTECVQQAYQSVLSALKSNPPSDVSRNIDELFACIQSSHLPNIPYIRFICREICKLAFKQYYKGEPNSLMDIYINIENQINRCQSFGELKGFVNTAIIPLLTNDLSGTYASPQIRKAISYMERHYASIQDLSEVAGVVYLNTDYFSRLFKKETGVNFSSYLNDLRLKKALELIRTTDLKICEIALKVGFSNLSYFSKRFKRKYGYNPQSIR